MFNSKFRQGAFTSVELLEGNMVGYWPVPEKCKKIFVALAGGGGGGGSGRRAAAGGQRNGGAGGASGMFVCATFSAYVLPKEIYFKVGLGGAGGAARSTNANGLAGSAGTDSEFYILRAYGGNGGAGGTSTTNNGGAALERQWDWMQRKCSTFAGAAASGSGTTGVSINCSDFYMPLGGASGGGMDGSNNVYGGGSSAYSTASSLIIANDLALPPAGLGAAAGGLGGNGYGNPYKWGFLATGGGGGGSSSSAAAGAGGNGAYGSGGGGGGAAQGVNSGAGGNGGNGYIVIVCFF